MASATPALPIPTPLLLLLLFLMSPVVATDDGDNFTNNLFSDLAPLLTLFGERFAQQFLSETFTWLDHIVFAMAPLGIITALVSAIRVGGPRWLKALVGRARENIAQAEVELMSSTSQDVCELYNGKAIVRTIGRPMVKQLIYLDWVKDEEEHGLFTLERPAGCFAEQDPQGPLALLALEATKSVHRVKDYVVSRFPTPEGGKNESDPDPEKGHLGGSLRKESQSPDRSTSRKKRQSVDNSDMSDSPSEEAPNISLNLHGWSDVSELALYAFLGIVLQVGVLVFSGFVAYNPRLNGKLGGSKVSVGFPLQVVGTVFLSLSMFLCSLVVDQSTKERRWVVRDRNQVALSTKNATPPNPRAGSTDGEAPAAKYEEKSPTEITTSPNPRASSINGEKLVCIFWLQKRHVAGDQSFSSYLLMSKQKRDEILTSRRSASVKADNPHQTLMPQDGKQNVGGIGVYGKVVEDMREKYVSTVTILGMLSGVLGFVAQFEGFRLSNWSSTIAQLVAVFFMTILRAVVRRGLIEGPVNKELPDEYEMDWLALQLAAKPDFLNDFGNPEYKHHPVPVWQITLQKPKQEGLGTGHRAVKIRQRLGQLTKWTGSASKEAITIANSIEIVMNKLASSLPQDDDFKWSVNVIVSSDEDKRTESEKEVKLVETIEFTVTRGRYEQSDEEMWRADATEIEAALSLWNYHFRRQYDDSRTLQQGSNQHDWLRPSESRLARPCRRVLGQDTDALDWDVAWWIGDGIAQKAEYEQSAENILWWGFDEMDSENNNSGGFGGELECFTLDEVPFGKDMGIHRRETGRVRLGQYSYRLRYSEKSRLRLIRYMTNRILVLAVNTPWEGSFAQHLFSAFMSAIAKSVERDKLGHATVDPRSFDVDDHETWSSPALENANLLRIAREIENTGLGTLDHVYLSMIPPLSRTTQLPNEAMVDLVRQRVHKHEVNCRWSKASKGYLKLLEMSEKRSPPDRFVYRAVAAVIEFLIQATTEPQAQDPDERDEDGNNLKKIESTLVEKLKSSTLKAITDSLKAKYVEQSRREQYERLLGDNDTHEDTGYKDTYAYEYKDTTDVLGWTRDRYKIFGSRWDIRDLVFSKQHSINITDIAGKTVLHYAAMGGKLDLVKRLLRNEANAGGKGRDGMMPLHWAATAGHDEVVKSLLKYSPWNDLDNAGRTALHLAAWKGHEGVVKLLLEKGANFEKDKVEITALHMAAEKGHEGVIKLLLKTDKIDVDSKDGRKRTPLLWAAVGGHEGVVELLLNTDKIDVNRRDDRKRTPLSWATAGGHEDVVKLLLNTDKIDVNRRDDRKRTPLSWAAAEGQKSVVELLLKTDKIDVDSKDDQKRTPLSWAAAEGQKSVVELLQSRGALY